jgi:hypothetical protein
MSFILDALKKLEQKRQRGSVPDIMTVHMPESKHRKRPVWLYLFAAALVLNAGILALWLRTPGTSTVSGPFIEQPKKPNMKESGPADTASSGADKIIMNAPAARINKDEKQKRQDKTQKTGNKPAKEQPPLSLHTPSPVPESGPPDINKTPPQQGIPELSQLPQPVQAELPPLTILGHIYSDSSTTRMVNINGDILREGDAVAKNIRIEEITENGVIFSYNGLLFRLRAF